MEVGIEIHKPMSRLVNFVAQQKNMPLWTCHQSIIATKHGYYEIRSRSRYSLDTKIKKIDESTACIIYKWVHSTYEYQVCIYITKINLKKSYIYMHMTDKKFIPVFKSELRVLKSILEKKDYPEKQRDYLKINRHHIHIYKTF
ncbi:hypothetical protein [Legionella qingyii]|nr:hypothetical protein [Legionella qingyii]RUR22477.1 hypothetical protein ELY20_09300 [Legionella qingyii]RUR27948.1 hypothetical protein ELY16_04035 [Legionella qingyii]